MPPLAGLSINNILAYVELTLFRIISSREDNTFMSYPVGSQFEWKSQVLYEIEKIAQITKFVIPLPLISFGLIGLKKRRASQPAANERAI
jgi:hypothetical protein